MGKGNPMGEHNTRALISFDCGHSRLFANPAPRNGDVLWCVRCRKERKVMTAPGEWKLKCRNCVYSRSFGQAQLNTEIAAAKHRMNHPHHVVDIYNGQVIRKTFGVDRNQTVIGQTPDSDQIPGF